MNAQVRNRWITVLVAASVAAIIMLFTLQTARADGPTFTAAVTDTLRGVYYSSVAWGDYDSDGDLDILLTGSDGSNPVTALYRNDGSDTFTEVVSDSLTAVTAGSVAWGDYDGDGDLDFLIAGSGGGGPIATIYRNDGGDVFTAAVTDTLPGVSSSSVAWGDYDNDGDLDILLSGSGSGGSIAAVYRSDGDDVFAAAVTDTLPGVSYSSVAWGDYDNDGDLDILITGDSGFDAVAAVYRNDGDDTFSEAVTAPLTGVYDGSVAWGDYDNDGDLDILLTGYYWDGSYYSVATIYRNDGGDVFTAVVTDTLSGVSYSSVAWGDYDNDGDLDILLTGEDSGFDRVATIYRNDGASVFTEAITDSLTGVSFGSVAWGDYDNDGDLDILLTGYDGSGYVARVYQNNDTPLNIVPAAPTNLNAQVAGNTAILSWTAPPPTCTIPITALTYNLRVGTGPGKGDVVPPHAFTAADPLTNGLRLLPQMGNLQHGLTATLEGLVPATYYWSVQAIDHTFTGSRFAPEVMFTTLKVADLAVVKAVAPSSAAPGETITYTIGFSNRGGVAASHVVITDIIPVSLTVQRIISSGVPITDTGGSPAYVWRVRDLAPGEGGTITITAVLSERLAAGTFTNTVIITTTTEELQTGDNSSAAGVMVLNAAPIASDDSGASYTTDEDTAFTTGNVLLNDTDSNGDTLYVAGMDTGGTLGQITDNGDGTFDYDPGAQFDFLAPGQQALDTFTYVASDGTLTDTAAVTITINGVNDPPTISNILNQRTDVGVAVESVPFTVGDVDDPVDSLVIDDASSNTALVPTANIVFGGSGTDRTLTVTPTAGMTGTATITVMVSDGMAWGYDTFVLSVGVNSPPEFASIPVETATAGVPYSYEIIAADADAGDALTVSAPVSASWLSLTQTTTRTAVLSGTPTSVGRIPVVLEVTDGEATAAQAFTVTVSASGAVTLEVSKSVDTGGLPEVSLGGVVTYTIVIENVGSDVATNVVMTDPLPAGVSLGSQFQGSALIALPDGIYQWGPYDVAARTAYTVAFTANVTDSRAFAGSTITNIAYVAASNAVPDNDSDSFTIAGGFCIYLPVVLRSN